MERLWDSVPFPDLIRRHWVSYADYYRQDAEEAGDAAAGEGAR